MKGGFMKILDDYERETMSIEKILAIYEPINSYDFLKEWQCIPIKEKEKEPNKYSTETVFGLIDNITSPINKEGEK